MILMAVSSQTMPGGPPKLTIQRWEEAGLLKPSVLKPLLATVDRTLVLRRLGTLQGSDLEALRECLREMLGD